MGGSLERFLGGTAGTFSLLFGFSLPHPYLIELVLVTYVVQGCLCMFVIRSHVCHA